MKYAFIGIGVLVVAGGIWAGVAMRSAPATVPEDATANWQPLPGLSTNNPEADQTAENPESTGTEIAVNPPAPNTAPGSAPSAGTPTPPASPAPQPVGNAVYSNPEYQFALSYPKAYSLVSAGINKFNIKPSFASKDTFTFSVVSGGAVPPNAFTEIIGRDHVSSPVAVSSGSGGLKMTYYFPLRNNFYVAIEYSSNETAIISGYGSIPITALKTVLESIHN